MQLKLTAGPGPLSLISWHRVSKKPSPLRELSFTPHTLRAYPYPEGQNPLRVQGDEGQSRQEEEFSSLPDAE